MTALLPAAVAFLALGLPLAHVIFGFGQGAKDASFVGGALMALPEVRLGIAPSVISPYLIERIGLSQVRRLALTGRRFRGAEAQALGLVHEVAGDGAGELERLVEGYVHDIL